MASEKEQMLSTANNIIGIVKQAQDACDAAIQDLVIAQATVSENWKGGSGDAMALALENLGTKLSSISSKLSAASAQMSSQAWSVYNSWPEEIELV